MLIMLGKFNVKAQNLCGFDDPFHEVIQSNPSYFNAWYDAKYLALQQQNYSSNATTVTIPIVFHIIFHDSQSNIPNSQIANALTSLNNDFAGTGIQFCPAVRDNEGFPLIEPGIKRIDGSSIGYIGNLTIGQNEFTIKNLSTFNSTSYLNIWVVSSISGLNGNGQVLGIATFPNTVEDKFDGVIMDRNFLGVGNWHVLTHEVGHFLGLLHTFEGDDPDYNPNTPEVCPSLNDTQGDHLEDTQAHIRPQSGACPQGNNNCYPGPNYPNLSAISNNHMNYTSESCRTQFTSDQVNFMNQVLTDDRPGLLNSLGCVPACEPQFAIDFDVSPAPPVKLNEYVTFSAVLPSSYIYSTPEWYVEGVYNDQGLTFTNNYNVPNSITVCVRAKDEKNCYNETCKEIPVITNSPCFSTELEGCELLLNGNFSQFDPQYVDMYSRIHYNPKGLQTEKICNWGKFEMGTPELRVDLESMLLTSNDLYITNDIIGTVSQLDLVDGNEYVLEFDYGIINWGSAPAFNFYFTNNLIEDEEPQNIFYSQSPINHTTYTSPNFQNIKYTFTYNANWGRFLKIMPPYGYHPATIILKNISIKEACCPIPNILVAKLSDCQYKFDFINEAQEPVDYFWEIVNITSGTSPSTLINFPTTGSYEVCLYMTCNGGKTIKEKCISVEVVGCENGCSFGSISPIASSSQWCEEQRYLVNVSIPIPEGFGLCNTTELNIQPSTGLSNVSYYFDETGSTNQIHLSMNSENPSNYYTLYLCGPNGNIGCFQFGGTSSTSSVTCDDCQVIDIPIIAECDDNNPSDNHFVYSATFQIQLPPTSTYCGATSVLPGFSIVNFSSNNGSYNFSAQQLTNIPNSFNNTIKLCFDNGGNKICYQIQLAINNPCTVQECIESESEPLTCRNAIAGNANFAYTNLELFESMALAGFELCEGNNVYSNIGSASISSIFTNSRYTNIVNLSIPCEDLERNNAVELTLTFCDGERIICTTITIPLVACEDCLFFPRSRKSAEHDINVLPNPARDYFTILLKDDLIDRKIAISNVFGKIIYNKKAVFTENIIDIRDWPNGLYFINVEGSDSKRIVYKFIVSR